MPVGCAGARNQPAESDAQSLSGNRRTLGGGDLSGRSFCLFYLQFGRNLRHTLRLEPCDGQFVPGGIPVPLCAGEGFAFDARRYILDFGDRCGMA